MASIIFSAIPVRIFPLLSKASAELPTALERTIHAVDNEKRQAVLNVICEYADGAAAADADS